MSKAIFWDLMGTLGGEATGDINNFTFYPFAYEALRQASKKEFINIVITNQSGIGKGLITQADFDIKINELQLLLENNSAVITEFLCCPHTHKDNCNCKKPKTGLIEACIKKHDIDIEKSYVIGDMGKSDIIMAKNAGCKSILVLTGGGKKSLNEFRSTWADYEADIIADNALVAIETI